MTCVKNCAAAIVKATSKTLMQSNLFDPPVRDRDRFADNSKRLTGERPPADK